MSAQRTWWTWWAVFGACALAVVAVLLWVTGRMVELEQAEQQARAEVEQEASIRVALWRMESWFAPQIAREAARPYFDYQSFYPLTRVYNRVLAEIEPGEVLTASPLLAFQSDYIRLHFQVDLAGRVTSPQVPSGSLRERAEDVHLSAEQLAENDVVINELRVMLGSGKELGTCVAVAESALTPEAMPPEWLAAPRRATPSPQRQSRQEWTARQNAYLLNQAPELSSRELAPASVSVGPLVPIWASSSMISADSPSEPDGALLFLRRIELENGSFLQGFMCDWPALRATLLAGIVDLFPDATLVATLDATPSDDGRAVNRLASIPAQLEVDPALTVAAVPLTTARVTLAIAWLAVAIALAAVAFTLHASIRLGDRRGRFASALTHELRTPLTTFRMYAEMLDEGWVQDEDQRRSYLRTLREESDRLARVVENVLAYARLERGRSQFDPQPTTLADLIGRHEPRLSRLADRADMTLAISAEPQDVPLVVDTEAVGQILDNLVDNAAKYANGAHERTIDLDARAGAAAVMITVRDHGPGIAPEHRRAVFGVFERGSRNRGDGTSGVGLGLALARGLARRLGGDLELCAAVDPDDGPGARFTLTLPIGGQTPVT